MSTVSALHGKNGRVKVAGSSLKITDWSGTWRREPVDATNTESNGYQQMSDSDGIESFNGQASAILESGGPIPITPGQSSSCVFIPGSKVDAAGFSGTFKLSEIQIQNQVRSTDPITYTFQFMSSGTITPPA